MRLSSGLVVISVFVMVDVLFSSSWFNRTSPRWSVSSSHRCILFFIVLGPWSAGRVIIHRTCADWRCNKKVEESALGGQRMYWLTTELEMELQLLEITAFARTQVLIPQYGCH